MGILNVTMEVDQPPEVTAFKTEAAVPKVEYHFVCGDGITVDLLMTAELSDAMLAAGAVERAERKARDDRAAA